MSKNMMFYKNNHNADNWLTRFSPASGYSG